MAAGHGDSKGPGDLEGPRGSKGWPMGQPVSGRTVADGRRTRRLAALCGLWCRAIGLSGLVWGGAAWAQDADAPETAAARDANWTEEAEACYQASARPSEGVVLCTKAIEAGGLSLENLAITYSNRGNSFFDLRRFQRAIDDYDIALGLVPADPVTLSNRGAAYTDLGDYANALEDLSRAVELDSINPTAWSNRCWVHILMEAFEEAVADCGKAIELAPTDPVALSSRAFAYLSMEKIQEALVDADKAVTYGPDLWEAYFYRGLIHDARRDKSKALEDLAKAFELGPDEPRVVKAMHELGFKIPEEGEGSGEEGLERDGTLE